MDLNTITVIGIVICVLAVGKQVLDRLEHRRIKRHIDQAIALANGHNHPSQRREQTPRGPEDEPEWIEWKEGQQ